MYFQNKNKPSIVMKADKLPNHDWLEISEEEYLAKSKVNPKKRIDITPDGIDIIDGSTRIEDKDGTKTIEIDADAGTFETFGGAFVARDASGKETARMDGKTGEVTTVTQNKGDKSKKAATTEFVQGEISALPKPGGKVDSVSNSDDTIDVDNEDPANPKIKCTIKPGGKVDSVSEADKTVTIDNTDAVNPKVKLNLASDNAWTGAHSFNKKRPTSTIGATPNSDEFSTMKDLINGSGGFVSQAVWSQAYGTIGTLQGYIFYSAIIPGSNYRYVAITGQLSSASRVYQGAPRINFPRPFAQIPGVGYIALEPTTTPGGNYSSRFAALSTAGMNCSFSDSNGSGGYTGVSFIAVGIATITMKSDKLKANDTTYYYIENEDKSVSLCTIEGENFVGVKITKAQYDEFVGKQFAGDVNYIENNVLKSRKKTSAEIESDAKYEISALAKNLWAETSKFEMPSYREYFSDSEWTLFLSWRKEIIKVIKGQSMSLPEIPEFIKKML